METRVKRGVAWSLALCLVGLSGCEILDRPQSTHFEAVTGGFKFRAIADAAYPEDTPNGEAQRLSWLAQNLRRTGTCPKGYVLTSRKAVEAWQGQLAKVYDVTYEGRCSG
jgi:hypothetical protein